MLRIPTVGPGKQFVVVCFPLLLLTGVPGCSGDCDTTDVYEAFQAAYTAPESFDAWIASHPGYFTTPRLSCLDKAFQRVDKAYSRELDFCDEVFTPGDDLWRGCIQDVDELWGFQGLSIRAMARAARGVESYAESDFGSLAIDLKIDNPGRFQALFVAPFGNELLADYFRSTVTCERCSRRWWEIF